MNGRVLVMCASRGRPERLAEMIESAENTSTHADIAVYVDEDQSADYAQVPGKYRLFTGPRVGQCWGLNHIAKEMPGYEAYGAATDDSRFLTPGWDQWVLRTASGFKGGIGVLAPYWDKECNRMDFPWATAKWVETAGSFTCLKTYHSYWDVALQILGEATQCAFAGHDDFSMWHAELRPGDAKEKQLNDVGRLVHLLYHVHNDARITCVWLAREKQAMIEKLRAAIGGDVHAVL